MGPTKLTKVVTLLVLVFTGASLSSLSAQQQKKKNNRPVANLFDEFGAVAACDLGARLDNFALQIQQNPGLSGFILVYGPLGSGTGSGTATLAMVKDYLINTRGLDEKGISGVYGGRNDLLSEPRVQLWTVPHGVDPPEPKKFDPKPELFKGMFYEKSSWDEIPNPEFEGLDDVGPGLNSWFSGYVDVLKQQPKAITYVVGFNGESSAPGAWKRMAEKEANNFKQEGFGSERFKIIYGGDSEEAKVQVWIQPAGEPPPVETVGTEPTPKVAVQVGDYSDTGLGYAQYEREAFKRLQETLTAFTSLRVCLIVRIGKPEPEEEEEASSTPIQMDTEMTAAPVTEPPPPPADLFKIADKWKAELSKLNIREDRVVIFYSKQLPHLQNSLESWVVPPGESLPDPDKIFEEEAAAESKPDATDSSKTQTDGSKVNTLPESPKTVATPANAFSAGKRPR